MLKGSNKLKKVILAILSIVAILGIATTATKIANNQKAKIMPASTHVTGQYDLVQQVMKIYQRHQMCNSMHIF